MFDLEHHAEVLGLTIEYEDLRGRRAELRESGTIVVNERMPYKLQRIGVAHECGHWWYRHRHHVGQTLDRRARWAEWQADEYAARLLIPLDAYIEAEHLTDGEIDALARELNVTGRMILAWQRAYTAGRIADRRHKTRGLDLISQDL